jgi:uncharacterized protein YkvS
MFLLTLVVTTVIYKNYQEKNILRRISVILVLLFVVQNRDSRKKRVYEFIDIEVDVFCNINIFDVSNIIQIKSYLTGLLSKLFKNSVLYTISNMSHRTQIWLKDKINTVTKAKRNVCLSLECLIFYFWLIQCLSNFVQLKLINVSIMDLIRKKKSSFLFDTFTFSLCLEDKKKIAGTKYPVPVLGTVYLRLSPCLNSFQGFHHT